MPAPSREVSRYSPNKIDEALLQLHLCGGNSQRASELTGIPDSTIRYWATDKHRDHYQDIVARNRPRLEQAVVASLERSIVRTTEVHEAALELTLQQIQEGKVKDAASVVRNLSVSRGVDLDKKMLLEGRPTQITEHRDMGEIIRSLETVAPGLVIDGNATQQGKPTTPQATPLLTQADESNAQDPGRPQ